MKRVLLLVVLLVAVTAGHFVYFQDTLKNSESIFFTTLDKVGNINIRHYKPMNIAEVSVPGSRAEAARSGFTILAEYFKEHKLALIAPVMQQKDFDNWIVRIALPGNVTINSLAKPVDSRIVFKSLPDERWVAAQFTGKWSAASQNSNTIDLASYIKINSLTTSGNPVFGYYYKPGSYALNRRNEIRFLIKEQ